MSRVINKFKSMFELVMVRFGGGGGGGKKGGGGAPVSHVRG